MNISFKPRSFSLDQGHLNVSRSFSCNIDTTRCADCSSRNGYFRCMCKCWPLIGIHIITGHSPCVLVFRVSIMGCR